MSDSSPQKWFKLEESFFKGVDHQLLQKLKAQLATEERATAIQRLTGLTDMTVCQHIAALNITVESLAALRLVPLVAVAWADDRIEDNERFKIIQCAEKAGLASGEPAYELLQSWLSKRPPQDLLDTWVEYARNLSQSLDGEARKNFQSTLVHQVQSIAEANGGLFGLGSISPAEHKVIDIVRQALA